MADRASRESRGGDSVGDKFVELARIMAKLRSEQGCPWDREQTHLSLRRYVLEEAYEVAGAIDQFDNDPDQLKEELGDLLLQVLFHAQLAQEEGIFSLADVADTLQRKLIRRHPHVFGEAAASAAGGAAGSAAGSTAASAVGRTTASVASEEAVAASPTSGPASEATTLAHTQQAAPIRDAAGVQRKWAEIKQQERSEGGGAEFADLSRGLPALVRATQVMRRAAEYGFTWRNLEGGLAKVKEEITEIEQVLHASRSSAALSDRTAASSAAGDERFAEELGDLLIATANLARLAGTDPEWALQRAVDKFIERFEGMQQAAAAQGQRFVEADLAQQLRWWQQTKQRERREPTSP